MHIRNYFCPDLGHGVKRYLCGKMHACLTMRIESVPYSALLAPIQSFLQCETPDEWIVAATKKENLDIVLIDHLICELMTWLCTLPNHCTTILSMSCDNGASFLSSKFTGLGV